MAQAAPRARIDWVDYARGFCIVMVVTMHSTLGVEAALGREGWMHLLVAFAKPFRMPDFFLISGLFAAAAIARDWPAFLDRKVVHFAYFYVLWLTIQFALKAPALLAEAGLLAVLRAYAMAFIEPFGTLWFIYLLPVFFVVTRLLHRLPVPLVCIGAALLEIAPIATGWTLIDEFCSRFVYFYSGYAFASRIFTLAEWAAARPTVTLALLILWAVLNAAAVASGIAEWPVLSLALGFAGAAAVVAGAALLARRDSLAALRTAGQRSLVIYLAFFLFMAAARTALVRSGAIADAGTIALLVTAAGVVGPLILHRLVRGGRLRFLFERPARFRLAPRRTLQPAE
jgi:uncharacterized membrane protein YcfT